MDNKRTLYLATTEMDLAKPATEVARALEMLDADLSVRVIACRAGEPVEDTLARVERADALIVLSAHLFGWVPAEEDGGDGRRSLTWLECQAAVDARIPVLAYVLDPLSDWTHRTTPRRRARSTASARVNRQLKQFKRWLGHEAAAVEYFERPSQLPDLVGFSVLSFLRRQQAPTQSRSGLTTLEDLAALDAALGPVDQDGVLPGGMSQPTQQRQRQPSHEQRQLRRVRVETVRGTATTDRPTEEDALGMTPYVDAVARFLASEDTQGPLTLSIEGPWGAGKSSFLLQLERRLRQVSPTARHARFDARGLQSGESPWAAYALSLLDTLEAEAGPRARMRAAWQVRTAREGHWTARTRLAMAVAGVALGLSGAWLLPLVLGLALPGVGAAIGVVGGLALACAATALALSRAWRLTSSPLRDDLRLALQGQAPRPGAELQRDLGITLRLLNGRRPLLCYLDDLDRCAVDEAEALLVAHERLGEELPLVGIVAMNRDRLAARLAARESADLSVGYEALERFVQLPVSLPRPDSGALAVFVDEALDPLVNDTNQPGRWLPGGPMQRGARAVLAQWEPEAAPRREALEIELGHDSATVRDLVLRLAPGLDHNPRRLKRFVNGFRLAAYVSGTTGLFAAPVAPGYGPLTLQQLGKIVVLGMRWPLALNDLIRNRDLAGRLESVAVEGRLPADRDARIERWADVPALMALLRAGIETGESSDEEQRTSWSLSQVDWRRLSPLAPALEPAARIGDDDLFPVERTEDLPLVGTGPQSQVS